MKSDTYQDYQARMLRVLMYIHRHLDDSLDLTELAGLAHFSPFHFHRVFRGMIGESVGEHVRRLRLERAARDLTTTKDQVTDIAFKAGYQTLESFSRAFKERFGLAPSRYRARRADVSIKAPASGISFHPDGDLSGFTPIKGKGASMDAEIKKLPERRVAFIRHIGPYNQVGPVFDKLCNWAGPKGLIKPGTSFMTLSYDDPEVTPAERLRSDACMEVDQSVGPEGEVGVQFIQGGKYACFLHKGPYDELSQTYAQICGQWFPENGHKGTENPAVEVYLNSPDETDPKDLLTEIQMLLEG